MNPQNPYLINGRQEACLTPLDRGLAYGDGVFRTLLLVQGHPQQWGLHYAKLSEDCQSLGIVCPSADILLGDIAKLGYEGGNAVLKIIVTRGEGVRGYAVPAVAQPNRIVIRTEMPIYPESNFSSGIQLHLCQTRLAHQPRLAGIKHLNRLENVLARMEWVDPQVADGLMLDQQGYVVECTTSNIFVRIGDSLITPDLSRCGVAGVTRQRILTLAPRLGYRTRITRFRLDQLLQAEEVIVCNSLYGAWQVRQMGTVSWPIGSLASRLRTLLQVDDAAVA